MLCMDMKVVLNIFLHWSSSNTVFSLWIMIPINQPKMIVSNKMGLVV